MDARLFGGDLPPESIVPIDLEQWNERSTSGSSNGECLPLGFLSGLHIDVDTCTGLVGTVDTASGDDHVLSNDDDMGIAEEDDEEIDSDEAFEESDEERFAGFSFSQKVCLVNEQLGSESSQMTFV